MICAPHERMQPVESDSAFFWPKTESEAPNRDSAVDWPDSERVGNNLKGVKDFKLKAKARIWPCMYYMCRAYSTADGSKLEIGRYCERGCYFLGLVLLRPSKYRRRHYSNFSPVPCENRKGR